MPLSRKPITGRRASDDAVSRAYGSRHCSTHTPNTVRPGRISDELTEGFGAAGYPLLTLANAEPPGLVEVYPHPALVEFGALAARWRGGAAALPAPDATAGGVELKAYEDMLDAVVCVCVAISILEGEALPYGDEVSAIWIPRSQGLIPEQPLANARL